MIEKDETQSDSLKFKPINPGLGFHPFSTGLPYSPPEKPASRAPSPKDLPPAGAMAAGPPRFAKSLPPVRFAAASSAPGISPSAIQIPRAAPIAAEPKPVTVSPEFHSLLQTDFGTGYLIRRVLAFAFDTTFNLSIAAGITFISLWTMGGEPTPVTDDILLVGLLFFIVLNWIVMTIEELIFKTTLGKKILRLRFENASAGTLLLRAFAFPVSVFFFGIGIFWALFDAKKRCWHDLAAKIQPVEIHKP